MDRRGAVVDGPARAVARDEEGVVGQAGRLPGAERPGATGFSAGLTGLLVDDAEELGEGSADGLGFAPAGQLPAPRG